MILNIFSFAYLIPICLHCSICSDLLPTFLIVLFVFLSVKSCLYILHKVLEQIYVCSLSFYFLKSAVCCVLSRLVASDSLWPHGLYPARLLCQWGFSRQEYWSVPACPPPGDLPNPGSLALQADSSPSEPPIKSNLQCFSFMDVLGLVSKLKVVFSLTFSSISFIVYIHK